MVVQLKAKNVEWMALLSVVKLELNKGVNNMGVTSGLKAVRRMTPEEIASNNKLKAESAAKSAPTATPAMRYAPLDLSDTGRPPLNLKNKKALNPSLQAPMTLYDRQMLKGK
jgi:hypothetical protein